MKLCSLDDAQGAVRRARAGLARCALRAWAVGITLAMAATAAQALSPQPAVASRGGLAPSAVPVFPEAQRLPPKAIVDDRQRTVLLPRPPQRIVSVLPSLTESVCALGLCDRLVGVDRYSNWPAMVKELPVVGGGVDPGIEAIVALKPDLVLMTHSSKALERLEALGVPVAALEVRSQAEVYKVLTKLDDLLGVPLAQGSQRVWAGLQKGLAEATAQMPARAQPLRAYFEVSRGPYAAGPHSFIGEILTQLGVGNVVSAELGPFPRLSPEFLLRAQPDVILMGHRSMQVAPSYPGWKNLKAVRGGHVCAFDEEQSNIIVRPGPRMAEAAQLMARCLIDKAPK